MLERIGFGGFFLDNIKHSLIKDCYESGSPEEYFLNLLLVIDEMDNNRSWLQPIKEDDNA